MRSTARGLEEYYRLRSSLIPSPSEVAAQRFQPPNVVRLLRISRASQPLEPTRRVHADPKFNGVLHRESTETSGAQADRYRLKARNELRIIDIDHSAKVVTTTTCYAVTPLGVPRSIDTAFLCRKN